MGGNFGRLSSVPLVTAWGGGRGRSAPGFMTALVIEGQSSKA